MEYVRPNPVQLKDLGGEAKVQEIIAHDPKVLGLGNLRLINKEFRLPGGGILDILLGDSSDETQYEVEVQLGDTDESHIIRTIEYWDIMRKRYPEYTHVAVIVAEGITSRFFNVIGLFNQYLPIIAIQMSGIELAGKYTIAFTKVLNLSAQRSDSEVEYTVATRKDWESYASPASMGLADQILAIARELNPKIEFNFNKSYITTALDGKRSNLLMFVPQKKQMKLTVRLKSDPEIDKLCEDAGFEANYSTYWAGYQFDIRPDDFDKQRGFFRDLIKRVYAGGNVQ